MSIGGMIHELIGCHWGHHISTPDDPTPCKERAIQIVVLHHGDQERAFKLCAKHRERVLQETTPHEEEGDG